MDGTQIIIDTDVIIDYLRRRSDGLVHVLEEFNCATTTITLFELLAVAVRSTQQEQRLAEFQTIVLTIPFDESATLAAATIWRNLQNQGQLIGLPDTLIAGICVARELPLLTKNVKHYARVTSLQVIHPEEVFTD